MADHGALIEGIHKFGKSDRQLLKTIRNADEKKSQAAVKTLIDRYRNKVEKSIYFAGAKNEEDREEARNEYYLKVAQAWRKNRLADLQDIDDPSKWLCGIAKNATKDYISGLIKAREIKAKAKHELQTRNSSTDTVERDVIAREQLARVTAEAQKLNPSLKPVAELLLKGYSSKAIIQALGISAVEVYRRISTIRKKLRYIREGD